MKSNIRQLSILLLTLLIITIAPVAVVTAGSEPPLPDLPARGAQVSPPVIPLVMDKDLRTLPRDLGVGPQREHPLGLEDPPKGPPDFSAQSEGEGPASTDGAALAEGALEGAGSVTPDEFANADPNFEGIRGGNPPDENGDVGPDHYVEMINSRFEIFDKDGTSLAGPFAINQPWVDAGDTGVCGQRNDGDPIVLYDHLADRWVISQFMINGQLWTPPNSQCIAVSRGPNPVTDGWYLYTFPVSDRFDYPKLGVWTDAYYMSSQRGFPGGQGDNQIDVWALDRANMLNGNPATTQLKNISGPAIIFLPCDLDGDPPPPGTPCPFARQIDGGQYGDPGVDRVEVWEFDVDWGVPANTTFTPAASLPVASFDSDLCGGGLGDTCVPQPGSAQQLDTIPDWPMFPMQYRDFGSHETLVFNHTVDVDGNGHAGIRWYELRRQAGAWSLHQQGTHSPDAGDPGLDDDPHRWMGSIAMDKAGNMALGFSASSDTLFPSVRYVGRLASDPLGLMPHGTPPDGEFTLVAGDSSKGGSRWGDYSSMRVDPEDGCTFWYTGEYVRAGSAASRVGAFRFPSCNPADLSIKKEDTPDPVIAGEQLYYQLEIENHSADNDATNVIVEDQLSDKVEFITDDRDVCTEAPTGTLTCDLGDLPAGESTYLRIKVAVDPFVVADAGGPTAISNTATVSSDQEDSNTLNDTATAWTLVEDSADLEVTKICKPDGPLNAGETGECTIFVDNHGPSAADAVYLTDVLLSDGDFDITGASYVVENPDGSGHNGTCPIDNVGKTLFCTLGDLLPGARATATVEITANEAVDINDLASVSSSTPDPDLSNNQAEGSISVTAVADLEVEKSAPASDVAGTSLTYDLTVTNNGPSTATNVVVEDIVPGGVAIDSVSSSAGSCNAGVPGDPFQPTTCTFDSLAPGVPETMTIDVTIDADTVGVIHNDAEVSSDVFDPDNSNDLASTDTDVVAEADLSVSKTDFPDPVLAGEGLSYQLTVVNNGPSTAVGVNVTDTLPTGVDYLMATIANGAGTCVFLPTQTVSCELGTFSPNVGEPIIITIDVAVDPSVPDGTIITNTATVGSSTTDPVPGNNSDSEQTTVNAEADLAISKTSDQNTYGPSETIIYTVTVANNGPSDAQNVVVTDALPMNASKVIYVFDTAFCTYDEVAHTLTCNLGTIAAQSAKSFDIHVVVKGNLGRLTNTATVATDTLDPSAANDTAVWRVRVIGGPGKGGGQK